MTNLAFLVFGRSNKDGQGQGETNHCQTQSAPGAQERSSRDEEKTASRNIQIFEAAHEDLKKVISQDFKLGLALMVVFYDGAVWADKNPKSSFCSSGHWLDAQIKETAKICESLPLQSRMPFILAFSLGADWSTNNPMP